MALGKETHPAGHLIVLPASGRKRNLVVRVVPVDQILQYGTALEDTNRLAIAERIDNGRDSTIGIDFVQKRRLLLGQGPGSGAKVANDEGNTQSGLGI